MPKVLFQNVFTAQSFVANVNEIFLQFSTGGVGGWSSEQWTVVVGATTAGIVFIGLMILLCCCCFCRKKKMMEKKNAKGKKHPFLSR